MGDENSTSIRPDRANPAAVTDGGHSPANGHPADLSLPELAVPDNNRPVLLEPVSPKALEPARPNPFPATEPPKTEPPKPGKEKPSQPGPGQKKPAPPRKSRSRKWLWIIGGLLAVVVMFLMFRGCSGTSSSTAQKKGTAGKGGRGAGEAPAAITAGQSKTGNINIYVDALGTVTPLNTVTLYSQITGQVIAVHYTEGQMVNKGDPLIDIDPRPYESMLTQAEGTFEHDQAVLAEAAMDLSRYQAAWDRNAIPRQELEDQEKLVQQYQGTVKQDQGTIDYDKVQLSYCHIVSPITGKVGLRLVDPGNTVFAGSSSTLVVITQLQPITVVFNVSEDDLAQVQAQLKGNNALEVDAYDRSNEKEIESGKLTSLDNEIDTTTGTVKFRAEFQNKTLTLFPNQFVNARLLLKTLKNVVLVPTAAIQHNGTSTFVYLIKPDSTVAVQQVTILTSNEHETAVTGLNAGADVATSGFDRLENNVKVTVNSASANQTNDQGNGSQGQSSTPQTGGSPTK